MQTCLIYITTICAGAQQKKRKIINDEEIKVLQAKAKLLGEIIDARQELQLTQKKLEAISGIKQCNKQGMQKFADLTKKLLALHRTNDLNRAIEDEQYRDKLYKEFAIQ